MSKKFKSQDASISGPALGSIAITPSDTVDLPVPVRAVTIGGTAGTIRYISAVDEKPYSTGPLPVGMHPIWASRILFTGTTATDMTGWI